MILSQPRGEAIRLEFSPRQIEIQRRVRSVYLTILQNLSDTHSTATTAEPHSVTLTHSEPELRPTLDISMPLDEEVA